MRDCRPSAAAALARFIELLEASLDAGERIDVETLVRDVLQEAEKPACGDKCEEALRRAARRLGRIVALSLLYEECEESRRNIIEKLLSENRLSECMAMLRELHERTRQLEAELTLCQKRCRGEQGGMKGG